MAKKVFILPSKPSPPSIYYTWNPEWYSQYESPWGIIEKFRFANEASDADIKNILGYNKRFKMTYPNQEQLFLKWLNPDKFKTVFGHDIYVRIENQLNSLTDFLMLQHSEELFIPILRYCSECMKSGHHSILHQYSLWDKCPFHNIRLDCFCPSCFHKYDYALSYRSFQKPFMCKCGYSFISNKPNRDFISSWKNEETLNIKEESALSWITLESEKKRRIQNLFYNKNTLSNLELINRILDVVNNNKTMRTSSFDGKIVNPIRDGYYRNTSKYDFVNKIHLTRGRELFKNTAKRIKNKFIDEEKFQHIVSQQFKETAKTELCPHSCSYIIWQRNLQDLDHYSEVVMPWKNQWDVVFSKNESLFKSDLLEEIFSMFVMRFGTFKFEHSIAFRWMFEKAFSLCLVEYYKTILRLITTQYKGQLSNSDNHTIIDNILNLRVEPKHPIYLFEFSDDSSQPIKFYWRNNENTLLTTELGAYEVSQSNIR